ncbi:protein HIDE1 [Perognathus longimembris pacificus]|uniref:protein HIDE1 n=1 Tax=Perognathus longimembris pacificus TaxID=214514 RepID=UPI0020196876|nr:protein HIDE1 [Perognathus longimembris pacificus]
MHWTVLLLAAGALAIPAPSIILLPPYPSSLDDPILISCTAPQHFVGANFTLYRRERVIQALRAPADQPGVTFNVSGGPEDAGGAFRCQYGVMGEHDEPQLSDLSQPVHVSFPVPTWILALSLSVAGVLVLLGVLVAVAVAIRKVKVKKQKQRERESCWAQVNFATTDMSFDNALFSISTKMTSEDPGANVDAHSDNSGPRKRPTSTSSSPELPEFSTFRVCQ